MIAIQKCILNLIMIVGLSGCNSITGDTIAENMLVDPGKFDLYTCITLSSTLAALKARELVLQGLMDKASRGPGGEFVNLISYRTEYMQMKGNQKLVLKKQKEKNCDKVQ
jgi:hypothetical protein